MGEESPEAGLDAAGPRKNIGGIERHCHRKTSVNNLVTLIDR